MWGRRKLRNRIREVENSSDKSALEDARRAQRLTEKAQAEISSKTPEVDRLTESLSTIRERNNFARYWRDALRGDIP